jgi:hypothetical protein
MALKFRQPETQNAVQVSTVRPHATATAPTTHTPLPSSPATTVKPQSTNFTPTVAKKSQFSIRGKATRFANPLNVIRKPLSKLQKVIQLIKKNPMRAYIWMAVICISLEIFQRGRYQLIQNGTLTEAVMQSTNQYLRQILSSSLSFANGQ